MGAESSTMQNAASACKGCKNLGNKHADTVKVDMSMLPEDSSDTGKENSNPGQMRESQAEKNHREEQLRLKQAEEEAKRRAEEEKREAKRRAEEQQRQRKELEMRKQQEEEQERKRVALEEEARMIAEQKQAEEEEEEARLRKIQEETEEEERQLKQSLEEEAARQRAEEEEEARRNERRLREFLGKVGFNAVSEKKVKKSLISSSFSYPLHAAVDMKDADAVNLLLKAGADPKLPNSKKLTPLALAQVKNKQGSHDKVIAALAA